MKHVDELKKAVTKGQSTGFLIPPKLDSGECESLKCVEDSALNWCNYVCIYLNCPPSILPVIPLKEPQANLAHRIEKAQARLNLVILPMLSTSWSSTANGGIA